MEVLLIHQIKMPVEHKLEDLERSISKKLRLKPVEGETGVPFTFNIVKKSCDARVFTDLKIVYSVRVFIPKEKLRMDLVNGNDIMLTKVSGYIIPELSKTFHQSPVVVGAGPAGLFAAYVLAEAGANPIVIERGRMVEARQQDIETFWKEGVLNPDSNMQFGEGGAGTFSDGKINTQVKDAALRKEKIIEVFIQCGAPEEIAYSNKPHIGTDFLMKVVKNMREKIIEMGGSFRFENMMTDVLIEQNAVKGIVVNGTETIETNYLVLAIGHSARDTFEMLTHHPIPMEPKAFAIGLRIEHPQEMISLNQYGADYHHAHLPVADYKLSHHASSNRGVYTFCMCPGGYVVNSASEPGQIVCNGMSYFARDGVNANSAIIVNVGPEDYEGTGVLAGVEYQRKWERKAYEIAGSNYKMPIQLAEDFMNNKVSTAFGKVLPSCKGETTFANLNECLPVYVADGIKEGIKAFDRKIKGFARPDALLTGIESRSSSPVRIIRNELFESALIGLYPCGEGSGYAGGIMSAAIDGIKVAEAILNNEE